MNRHKKKEIFAEFWDRKSAGEKGVAITIAKREGLTKVRIYQILKDVEVGRLDTQEYNEAQRVKREALWKNKFAKQWKALPANRKKGTVAEVKRLVCEMIHAGFGVSEIERLCGKHRTTIMHHANDCEI